jgi:hypothetical protein
MTTREIAVMYATHGWPVFPLWPIKGRDCACTDLGCTVPGKHPITRGWPNAIASVAAAESSWADRLGDRGIGIPLGPRAGMWVLDIDPRHNGYVELAHLERDYGPLPDTLCTQTGGGGQHRYFAWPDDGKPLTNANGLPAGLDTRGEGGYAVLPPSLHASGERYRWLVPPRAGKLEPAPSWLLELVRQRQRSLPEANGAPKLVPVGRRHQALVSFCGHLRSMGLGEEALLECGHAFLRHQVEVDETAKPIDWEHADRSIRSIARSYPPEVNR